MNASDYSAAYKDSVLKFLCDNFGPYNYCTVAIPKTFTDLDLFNTCLFHFQELGLLREFALKRNLLCVSVVLTGNALDLLNRGGFTFIEDRALVELKCLELELQKFQAENQSDKHINRIAQLLGIVVNLKETFGALIGHM